MLCLKQTTIKRNLATISEYAGLDRLVGYHPRQRKAVGVASASSMGVKLCIPDFITLSHKIALR